MKNELQKRKKTPYALMFYQCFIKGLPCFTVFKTGEKEILYRFNVTSSNTNGFIASLKLCLS